MRGPASEFPSSHLVSIERGSRRSAVVPLATRGPRLRHVVRGRRGSFVLSRVSAIAMTVFLIAGARSAFGQGSLGNGLDAAGAITAPGQTQTWTFAASQGDGFVLSVADGAVKPDWGPWAVLRAPDGASLGAFGGPDAGQTRQTASQTGTYTVVVGANPNTPNQTGPYILRLAKAPGNYDKPSGDQGGDLTNGQNHPGTITLGDLDLWSFHAEAGDALCLTVADETPGSVPSLAPYIQIWGPTGASLASGDLGLATQACLTAPLNASGTGSYTVLISANINAPANTGDYTLRLARAPASFVVPSGDQGGDLTNGQTYPGNTITRGDLDLWRFAAQVGDPVSLTLTTVNGVAPWMRVWGPQGGPNLAFTGNGQAVQQLNFTAPLSGVYTVVISASTNAPALTAGYTLLATGVRPAPSQPRPHDLVINFGATYGMWVLSGSTWMMLHNLSPVAMVSGDLDGNGLDDLVVNFGDGVGVWAWMNHATWTFIHSLSPSQMVTGDFDQNGHDEIVFVFSGYGVWRWNDGSWSRLHQLDAAHMAVGNVDGMPGDDLIVDFPGYGVYVFFNNGLWKSINGLNAKTILTADLDGNGQDEIVIDFANSGLWVYRNNSTWTLLHGLSPSHVAAGDIDGEGHKDLVIDFGAPFGLWTFRNNTTWAPLNPLSAEDIVVADRDGSGRDEVVIDFGPSYGLWEYANDSAWSLVHGQSPRSMVSGRFQ